MPIILLMPRASCAYWFLAAAAINYCLKHRLIILPFQRSEVQTGLAGLCSSWKLQVDSVSLLFPDSTGCLYSLTHGPFPHLQSQECNMFRFFRFVTLPSLTLLLPSFPYKDLCEYSWPPKMIKIMSLSQDP